MNLIVPSLIAACAVNLAVGLYVLRCNYKRAQNVFFAIFSCCVGVWTLAAALAYLSSTLAVHLAFAAASLIPVGLGLTLDAMASSNVADLPRRSRWLVLVGVLFAILSFTPYIVVASESIGGEIRLVYGPLHSMFCLYIVGGFCLAGLILCKLYRTSHGERRIQIKYLALGVLVPAVFATVTNVILPFAFSTSRASLYGPVASLPMMLTIAHALVRHRLMDVRVVIKRGFVYLAAVGLAGALLLLLLVGSSLLVPDEHQMPFRQVVLALLVAMAFNPLKGMIQRGFDRYLYREPYDYQREIRETSRVFTGTVQVPELLEHVETTLKRTVRPEWQAVFLLDEEDGDFAHAYSSGRKSVPSRLVLTAPVAERVATDRKAIFRDELEAAATELRAEMSRLGAEVIVPLATEGRVIGLLIVGPKRSGDAYFSDDADLLSTLADQSAVAIRNAQAHQQVLEANEYIQRILETIESGVISVSARGHIRLFNRAAEVMTGGRAELLRGRPVGHLPPPLASLIEATLGDAQCRTQSELALPDLAGQIVPLMCSTAPLFGPHQVLLGAVAVLNDLSRLKELEREKRRTEHLAAIEAIASGLVHEIQNPLVALKTFSQLLPSRGDDPEFRERFARISDREITRIDVLVRRFRTLAAPASQPMGPVDVTHPLQATLDLLGPQIEERRIRLRYVADGTPRTILGNASQLEQLFLNVCLNALEAMEPQGELTVRVADLCAAGGATLLVEVCDSGSGIAEELLPTIFNPFVTTKARGSGLGLAICRSIADAHRATLTARNNVARPGSTFTIEFPVPTGTAASLPT